MARPKFSSLDELSTSFDEELIWRRKELSDLRQAIKDSSETSKDALIRAFIPISYAHWEGFVLRTAQMYFSYIASRRYAFSELTDHFLHLTLLRRLESLSSQKPSLKAKFELLEGIDAAKSKRFSSMPPDLINTGSNLNSVRAKQICKVCGIPDAFIVGREDFIDKELLKRRNQIAHGEWAIIGRTEVKSFSDAVMSIMTAFRNELENALVNETFRRNQ